MDRDIDAMAAGDLAVFRTAGAYGATMASSYNSRGFVAEVMVDGDKFAVVADRIAPAAIMRRRARAGVAAERDARSPLFHRIAGQPVVVLGEGEAAEAKRRLVERAGGDRGAARTMPGRGWPSSRSDEPRGERRRGCKARGLLVNVADRPELCDFTMPSLLDRDPVLVAVGTGGASAGLAKALRLRLEALAAAALGQLARRSRPRARLRARWPDAAERRRALDAALTEGGALDPLRGGDGDAVHAGWPERARARRSPVTKSACAAPIPTT